MANDITTEDILRQYGPEPEKPKDEHGFLFSNIGGQLKFNPWESLKSFMGSGHAPGYLSTSGDAQSIRSAADTAGWVGMPSLGLNYAGLMPTNALGAAGGKLASKSATVAPRELDDLGFYSAALEGAKSWPMERGSPQQALAHLKKSGTKDAEIAATGLDKYLAEQDVITRQALEDYLRQNRVKLNEGKYAPPGYSVLRSGDDALMDGPFTDPLEARSSFISAPMSAARRGGDRFYISETFPEGAKGAPKWAEYSLDGMQNPTYRESVMHLPEETQAEIKRLAELKRTIEAGGEGLAEYDAILKAQRDRQFRSGHWDEPNVVAHMRTSIQPDEAGRPAFLIDELQSDWGQKLREGGVRDEAKIAELRRAADAALAEGRKSVDDMKVLQAETMEMSRLGTPLSLDTIARVDRSDVMGRAPTEAEKALAERARELQARMDRTESEYRLRAAELRTAEATSPGHPLVNTTDQWTTTGIRRLLQQAAEADAAGLALTPGQLQNERFNLARQVGALRYSSNGALNYLHPMDARAVRNQSMTPDAIRNGGWRALDGVYKPEELPGVVGKEIAEKLLAAEANDIGSRHLFLDQNTEIGGGGMRYAYDQMYPKKIAKELKRLDPEHPGYRQETLRPHGSELTTYAEPFHYFELTPRAKEEIRKGLPLFQHGLPVTDLLRAYYGEDAE